jgi:hypothetical protein
MQQEKIKLEEIPEPVGAFIMAQPGLTPLVTDNGYYWHYKDVVTLLTRYAAAQHPAGCEWVKCSDRLPGHKKRVKWRDGDNPAHVTDGEISLFEMEKPYLDGWEWYDESPSKEGDVNASYELRLALRDILKLVRRISGDNAIPDAHQKRIDAADSILKKHSSIHDILRTSSPNEPEQKEAVDSWIDVNDRLPYKDGDSSVYCLVNDTYDGIVVRPFNEVHECWDQEDGDDYYTDARGGKITHWKPLPEPPKRKPK